MRGLVRKLETTEGKVEGSKFTQDALAISSDFGDFEEALGERPLTDPKLVVTTY